MQVTDTKKVDKVSFRYIMCGDCFYFEEDFYIRIIAVDNYNAVRLHDGWTRVMDLDNDTVEPVEIEGVVK